MSELGDEYAAAVYRSYRAAEVWRKRKGNSSRQVFPYRRLVDGSATLECFPETGIESINADYAVAIGNDGVLYLVTGNDNSCHTPITGIGSVSMTGAKEAAREAIKLLAYITIKVPPDDNFLTRNSKVVGELEQRLVERLAGTQRRND